MTNSKLAIWLGLAALSAGVLVGCKEKPQSTPAEPNNVVQQQAPQQQNQTNANAAINAVVPKQSNPKPTLNDIIARRRSWGPAYTNWYGKRAPDFTVTDITGKTRTLSEYRGKNVMLIFWATWCRPCLQEIPHLIELRKTIGQDRLAMLAISFIGPRTPTATVKKFVADNPVINYTIISTSDMTMPAPYNTINALPTTFFIDPDGRIKIVTEGMTPLPNIKAILEAEL